VELFMIALIQPPVALAGQMVGKSTFVQYIEAASSIFGGYCYCSGGKGG